MFSKERLINAAIAALVAFLTGIGIVPMVQQPQVVVTAPAR